MVCLPLVHPKWMLSNRHNGCTACYHRSAPGTKLADKNTIAYLEYASLKDLALHLEVNFQDQVFGTAVPRPGCNAQ